MASLSEKAMGGRTLSFREFDFTALDLIMPHPVYGWMGWVCVLNPSEKTFQEFETLILESYEYAGEKFAKRGRELGLA